MRFNDACIPLPLLWSSPFIRWQGSAADVSSLDLAVQVTRDALAAASFDPAEASQLVFGPMAMTRAMCPPGSLHDRIVKDMPYVRSYVIKDGHLFLSLMADGGIYELEPLPKGGGAAGAKSELIATFHQTDPSSVLVERGDRTVLGMQVRAASSAKYEGANLMFWEHQGDAQVTWMKLELKCKPQKCQTSNMEHA